MVDMGSANIDAATAMGVLSQHDKDMGYPDGYTAKIVQEAMTANSEAEASGYAPYLNGEERTVFDWWEDDVAASDKWQQLVKDYEHVSADGKTVQLPAFDSNGQYVQKPASGFQPPSGVKTFSGDGSGSGAVAFAADAIQFFINNINGVAQQGSGMLLDSRNKLAQMPELKPGLFARAELLRQTIVGSGNDAGLRGDTAGVLQTIHSALYDLGQDLGKVLSKYKTSDDLNRMSVDDFGKDLGKSSAQIKQIQNYGGSSSAGTSTGSSGSGSSGSGSTGSSGSGK